MLDLSDLPSTLKERWQKEEQEKIQKNIEKLKKIKKDKIYNLLKNLCVDFYNSDYNDARGASDYLEMQKEVKKAKQFSAPEFCWYGRPNRFDNFAFFEIVDPTKFKSDVENNRYAVSNYLERFSYHFISLFKNSSFINFLFDDENINRLKQILECGFFTENLTDIWDILIAQCNDKKMEKIKNNILNYLTNSSVISVCFLEEVLFNNDFYKVFNNTSKIKETIKQAINKVDSRSLKNLSDLVERLYWHRGREVESCFYIENSNDVETLLIDKIAESFGGTKISLQEYANSTPSVCSVTKTYVYVHKFVVDYLKNNQDKNDERCQMLINGLKKWVTSEKFICIGTIISLAKESNDNSVKQIDLKELFWCDDDLKKSFIDSCIKVIKEYMELPMSGDISIDELNNYMYIKKYKKDIESFLGHPDLDIESYFKYADYKSHLKNIALLIFWLFIVIICITAIAACCALIPTFGVKCSLFLLIFLPICVISYFVVETCIKIHNNRIYNAILCICKSKDENDAKRQLNWDMLHTNKVQCYFNKCYPIQVNEQIRND